MRTTCYGCWKEIYSMDKIPMCETCLRATKQPENKTQADQNSNKKAALVRVGLTTKGNCAIAFCSATELQRHNNYEYKKFL
jgi:hypothetical protein